jgi:hypothetical protein
MRRDLVLRTPEPVGAIARHPTAAAVGGVVTGLVFGAMGALAASPAVAVLMTLFGLVIGAPGAAYVAASIRRD